MGQIRKSEVVVCDCSPLIFLAKLDCLDLISSTLDCAVHVLSSVVDELFQKEIDSREEERLRLYLARTKVIDREARRKRVQKLSPVDLSSLDYCLESADRALLADDRLLRNLAKKQGVTVIGVLGILVKAYTKGLHSKQWVRAQIDELITKHDIRISSILLNEVMSQLEHLD